MIWLYDLDDLEKTAHDLGSDHLMGNPRNHRKSSKFFSGRHSNSCETILHKTVRSDPSLRNPSPQKPKCMCFPGKNDGCDWCDFQKYQAVMGWILSELITVRAEDIKGRAAGRRLHVWLIFFGIIGFKAANKHNVLTTRGDYISTCFLFLLFSSWSVHRFYEHVHPHGWLLNV